MNFRTASTLLLVGAGAALLLFPGGNMMRGAAALFGQQPNAVMAVAMTAVMFCAVYFGTLKLWELLTGDRLQKPFPQILAVWLGVRLTVDCARMLRWLWW